MTFPATTPMSSSTPRGLHSEAAWRFTLAGPGDGSTTPMPTRSPGEGATIDLVVRGRFGPADATVLVERIRRLLEGGHAGPVLCEVGALANADLGTVDALARLELTARRLGTEVLLRHASPELRGLLAFAGLGEAVPCLGSGLEVRGQAEGGEEPRGVEEEADAADPTA